MEKQGGIVLIDLWDELKGREKVQMLNQVIEIEKRLAATKFFKLGSLYYKGDLPVIPNTSSPLYVDSTGKEVRRARWILTVAHLIGSTIAELVTAIAQSEIATAKAGLRYPLMPEGLFYGPQQYQPTLSKQLSALENYLKNIFVDPQDPGRITGIIDWQSVSAWPLFMQVGHPAFLDYNGPVPEEVAKYHLPPDFDTMDTHNHRDAKALHTAQTLYNLHLVRCFQSNKTVFWAFLDQNTLRHQVSVTPGLVMMDYEPLLNTLLRDVQKKWTHIIGVSENGTSPITVFPLQFSGEAMDEEERKQWREALPFAE
ncbi:hypothetical protein BJX65DRAFT_307316 [Aspergillus insuetus]